MDKQIKNPAFTIVIEDFTKKYEKQKKKH